MSEHDDDQFRASLRRAVTTTQVDDAWPIIARRVRRQRAGRAAARAGIPALCAVVLLGGAFALSRRGDGSGGVGTGSGPSTTSAATVRPFPTASSATVAEPVSPSADVTASTVPGPIVTPPVTTAPETSSPVATGVAVPSDLTTPTWTDVGTMTAMGTTLDLAAFVDPPGSEACVQARSKGASTGPDLCGAAGRFGVSVIADELWVLGLAPDDRAVTVETTTGSVTVRPPMLLGWYPWAVRLPVGTELVRVGDGVSAADCPYRPIIATIRASGSVVDAPFPVTVEKCAGGVAGLGIGGSLAVRQGAAAILEKVDGRFDLINLGGDLCNRDPALQTSARELAACDKIGWGI